jgi:biotin synthase
MTFLLRAIFNGQFMQTSTLSFFKPAKPQDAPEGGWQTEDVLALYELPLFDLLWQSQQVHRANFDPNAIQRSTLLSIKTGGCSEDCGYCSQSARYDTELERERLLELDEVLTAAKAAKDKGASRFCMGAAWRGPKDQDLAKVVDMVREVKALGMQTCVTLGMLKEGQAEKLAEAGLDYYNHNLDTDADYYNTVVSSHSHADRLDTLEEVRSAGINVCSGGIVGMGESRKNRAAMIAQLANLPKPPESVPINNLVPIPGTPMSENPPLDPFEFVRTIAAARITMPKSFVRLSAGRQEMSDELQAMCFLAGANSMFYGERLLTTGNPDINRDDQLFTRLGLKAI